MVIYKGEYSVDNRVFIYPIIMSKNMIISLYNNKKRMNHFLNLFFDNKANQDLKAKLNFDISNWNLTILFEILKETQI